jgi:hypothetical protein
MLSVNYSTINQVFYLYLIDSVGDVSERIHVRDPPPSIDQIIQQNPRVQRGGLSFPENCTTVQKVAVLITYQDRWLHLRHLLARLHALLQRQQCHYRIFVAEQVQVLVIDLQWHSAAHSKCMTSCIYHGYIICPC